MQLKNNKSDRYFILFSFFASICLITFNDFVSNNTAMPVI